MQYHKYRKDIMNNKFLKSGQTSPTAGTRANHPLFNSYPTADYLSSRYWSTNPHKHAVLVSLRNNVRTFYLFSSERCKSFGEFISKMNACLKSYTELKVANKSEKSEKLSHWLHNPKKRAQTQTVSFQSFNVHYCCRIIWKFFLHRRNITNF